MKRAIFKCSNIGGWKHTSELSPRIDKNPRRRKRQYVGSNTAIKGITIDYVWRNFYQQRASTCYSKIRVFKSDGITQIHDANIAVIQQSDDQSNFASSFRAYTDNQFRDNGYCIAHPCKNDVRDSSTPLLHGYIIVDAGKNINALPRPLDQLDWQILATGLNYKTQNNLISVQMNLKRSENNGPFYDWIDRWWNSEVCTYANISENSFDFITSLIDCELVHPNPSMNIDWDNNLCHTDRYKRLHNFANVIKGKVESCYIKVYAPEFEDSLFFSASSRVGNASNEYISPGDLYGITINCLRDGYTCLEVKTPDGASCSETEIIDDSFIHVTINPIAKSIPLKGVSPVLSDLGITIFDDEMKLSFGLTYDMITKSKNSSTGIICETAETVEIARAAAKTKCFDSLQDNWAIHFEGKMSFVVLVAFNVFYKKYV